ncbi:Bcr/CflA family efflux MFS transporter [Aromatoleum toluvorans]|uniref:Bcr/CflA family efflux transporter n=1 Tax=Aromatoleum toluvorans TaxID=92002 RepID=A0ABX1Q1S7_9RHOO|nr:multidrug effflux MFS transporter [Aromatoleum toluvorans]NMG44772.1 Bcr/CflA family efflux MFS transporter [Aromatoleum toluvorans]
MNAAPSLTLAILVTALVALGPLSTDFYLPALPAITTALVTDVAHTQLTLSVYLSGFAVGQLAYGPLSDRYGRRPALLFGIAVYLVASIACIFAASIEALIVARFLQALGACAGPVLGRAVVRDVYGPHDSARMLSYVGTAMALAPLVGPMLGGWLTVWSGWRATFVFLAVYSALLWGATALLLRETNPHLNPSAGRPAEMLTNFATLLRDRRYRGVLMCNALAYAGLFAFISGASFVFIGMFGFTPQEMGLAFGLMVSGYMSGTTASGRLSRRLGPERLMRNGALLGVAAGGTMLGLALGGVHHPLAVMLPMWFSACSIGLVMPNAAAIGLAPYPHMAGSAASLMGCSQMGLAALAGVFVGHSLAGSVVPMAFVIAATALGSLASYVFWVRRPAPAVCAGES